MHRLAALTLGLALTASTALAQTASRPADIAAQLQASRAAARQHEVTLAAKRAARARWEVQDHALLTAQRQAVAARLAKLNADRATRSKARPHA